MIGKKRMITVLILFGVCLLVRISIDVSASQQFEEDQMKENTNIIVLSVDDIRMNGYPVNDKGQSYGPDVKESTEGPDLILVESRDGDLGYVKAIDLNGADYKTPEEALSYKTEGRWVNLYLSDGETKIGEFYIGK